MLVTPQATITYGGVGLVVVVVFVTALFQYLWNTTMVGLSLLRSNNVLHRP